MLRQCLSHILLWLKHISEIWILPRLIAVFPGHPINAEISWAWRGQFRADSSATKAFQFLGNLGCGSSSSGDKIYTTGGLGHYKQNWGEKVTKISDRYRYLATRIHEEDGINVPFCLAEYFLIGQGVCEMWTLRYGFLETLTKQPMCSLYPSPPTLVVFSLSTYIAAKHKHTTSMRPGGERLLIVSPFHRLQAVRILCGSGSQSQT